MKKICLILLLSLNTTIINAACYTYSEKDITASWTAFKTPLKAAVGGKFSKLSVKTKNEMGSLKDLLVGATFKIDTTSVSTGQLPRDKTIVDSFFKNVEIEGEVISASNDVLEMMITMNKKKNKVKMSYKFVDNKLQANGAIDIFDFMMNKNLKSLNNACKLKHEGKTWNDVSIELNAVFGNCKD